MLVMDSLPPQRSCPGSKFTTQRKSIVLEAYRKHVEERAAEGVPAKPLDAEQVAGLVELLKSPPAGEEQTLVDLITHRVPPGVDERSEEHTSELQSRGQLVCRLLLEKK